MARNKRIIGKRCIRCNRTLPLEEFYANKLWASQQYRDAWCKDCARNYTHTHEDLAKYCFENNRKLKDKGWEAAMKKGKYSLTTNKKYIDPDTPEEEKRKMEEAAAVQAYFQVMNSVYAYEYEENVNVSKRLSTDEVVAHEFSDPEDKPKYDKVWRGWFTPSEIQMLEDIYAQYEEDFVLDNVNIRDYARKVAKASLNADIAEDNMRRGQGTAKEYNDAQKIFDDLSKSSNFAACRRKPGENTGMGSLGNIILGLETDGFLNSNPYVFPDDDVDKVIHDFLHTIQAIGADVRV